VVKFVLRGQHVRLERRQQRFGIGRDLRTNGGVRSDIAHETIEVPGYHGLEQRLKHDPVNSGTRQVGKGEGT